MAVAAMAAKLYRKLPEATRYTKQQLNTWRDFIWGITIGHARDWLAMSMLGEEARPATRMGKPVGPIKGSRVIRFPPPVRVGGWGGWGRWCR